MKKRRFVFLMRDRKKPRKRNLKNFHHAVPMLQRLHCTVMCVADYLCDQSYKDGNSKGVPK